MAHFLEDVAKMKISQIKPPLQLIYENCNDSFLITSFSSYIIINKSSKT